MSMCSRVCKSVHIACSRTMGASSSIRTVKAIRKLRRSDRELGGGWPRWPFSSERRGLTGREAKQERVRETSSKGEQISWHSASASHSPTWGLFTLACVPFVFSPCPETEEAEIRQQRKGQSRGGETIDWEGGDRIRERTSEDLRGGAGQEKKNKGQVGLSEVNRELDGRQDVTAPWQSQKSDWWHFLSVSTLEANPAHGTTSLPYQQLTRLIKPAAHHQR